MKIGAHVSTSGGISNAIDRAVAIGAEAIQIFASPPQSWRFTKHSQSEIDVFKEKAIEHNIETVFFHGAYLINLGSENGENLEKAIVSLTQTLEFCSQIGGTGVIFHSGSHKGRGYDAIFEQAVSVCEKILEKTPDDTYLIIENSAGMGNHIGSKFYEIGRMISALDSPRVKVCLDTQHTFAAGYDITKTETLDLAMKEFEQEIGFNRLMAVHANDSKTAFASGVDRHENIGEGHIGREGFLNVLRHPAFRDVPFILEVPGMDATGPDKENIERLKALRQTVLGSTA